MAAIKEHIAQYTRSEVPPHQQPVADDPLAPKPIRFTDWRDADGVLHQRTVNGPTAGWHLENETEASDAEPPPPRGQASTPSRQTRDYQQQARVTQAYLPDYEDADDQYTAQAAHHAAPCATRTRCPTSTGGRPCCLLPRSACATSVSSGMLPVNSNALPHDAASTGRCTW